MWGYTSIIPALRKLREEDYCKCKASLDYVARPYPKEQKQKAFRTSPKFLLVQNHISGGIFTQLYKMFVLHHYKSEYSTNAITIKPDIVVQVCNSSIGKLRWEIRKFKFCPGILERHCLKKKDWGDNLVVQAPSWQVQGPRFNLWYCM